MSTGRATWTPSEVQQAIAEDFAYVVNSAADQGDSTMDLCISYLPDEVAEMLADSVVRAGLAYNTPPPALTPTAPPSSSTSTAPQVAAYKAPPRALALRRRPRRLSASRRPAWPGADVGG